MNLSLSSIDFRTRNLYFINMLKIFVKLILLITTSLLSFSLLADAKLDNETEVGIAAANGNTQTETYNFKQTTQYKNVKDVFGLKSRYLNATSEGEETARYFLLSLRYEKEVSSRLGLFAQETFEKDRFANIDQRFGTDIGGRYHFIETDPTKFFSELGYRYFHEDRLDGSQAYSNYGRLYTEWENKWRETFSTKIWIEYLPNFTEQKDWQFNSELSLTAILTEIFSLKSSFLLRRDNSPAPGVKYKNDTLLTTAIVAKF